MTLKEIALELLEKYRISETSCIWEFSIDIAKSKKNLSSEIQKYKELIEASASVVERKRGKWVSLNGWITCSECGCEPPNETNIESDFCPNCGADMRGEK